jgi:Exodeoxyribonuclease VII small subunit (EC 3.1.11.6)
MTGLKIERVTFTMPKKNDAPASFETALNELEQIVTRLESGDLPLEEALNEFERGVQLARQGQVKLQQAEQRVQILLSDSEDAKTTTFTPDAE